MTPAERLVTRELKSLADIPVTEQDIESAHEELKERLRALPSLAARRTRTRLVAAVAAVAVLAAGAAWVSGQRSQNPEPGHRESASAETAIRTASDFVGALGVFDVPRARTVLAPGATFTGSWGPRGWATVVRFFQETGGRIRPAPCRLATRSGPEFVVHCPFRFQLMRSGALGLGPYAGSSFEITTRDGKITQVDMSYEYTTNGFHSQMWAPFAAWIDAFHYQDGHWMYPDWPGQSQWPATDHAIRLWAERTRQFVRYARHLCGTTQGRFAAVCSGLHPGG